MSSFKITRQITNRDSEVLKKYLYEVARIPVLTLDEENGLSESIQQGNQFSRHLLVVSNLRFVISVSKQYCNQGLPFCDLINEGNIGLIRAASLFNPCRGFRFITYAVWWIRQSILRALADHARLIKMPQNKIDIASKINKKQTLLEQEFQREPSLSEIAASLNLSLKQTKQTIDAYTHPVSIDSSLVEEESPGCTLNDFLTCEKECEADHELQLCELKKEIERLLTVITEKESDILCDYFGLQNHQAVSLEFISQKQHLTRERVRQIKDRAIMKLRESGLCRVMNEYLDEL